MLVLLQFPPSPWRGVVDMSMLTPAAVGQLIAQTPPRAILSLVTFEGTVDLLAELAGRGVARRRTTEKTWWTPARGDRAILCQLRPEAKGKAQADLRAADFDFWLYHVIAV